MVRVKIKVKMKKTVKVSQVKDRLWGEGLEDWRFYGQVLCSLTLFIHSVVSLVLLSKSSS